MTTQEKTQKIREACIASNPSILDLVMGCRVTADFEIFSDVVAEEVPCTYIREAIGLPYPALLTFEGSIIHQKVKEILGRTIRLADVLLVIGKTKRGAWGITIDALGYIRERGVGFNEQSYSAHWNLLHDDLELQSPETIDFIFSLIDTK